ncbi:MAG TPA: HEPN domain-containing protein [Candidatus Limnocylindria bacterium]|nr:HEPN domain-containing protein [Candidatus Limnocylindria bacterium]
MPRPKAHAVERVKCRTYLSKADQFLAVADAAIADARNDAALLLAIHSAISAADAVTAALGGLRSADPDHLRAADLLESVSRGSEEVHDHATQLRGLLKLKNLVEYEDRRVTAREAELGVRRAERFAAWARTQVGRSGA